MITMNRRGQHGFFFLKEILLICKGLTQRPPSCFLGWAGWKSSQCLTVQTQLSIWLSAILQATCQLCGERVKLPGVA